MALPDLQTLLGVLRDDESDCDWPRAVWFDARRSALTAYRDWCSTRDEDAYVRYRAAADRADAAQDRLARGRG
jgi:hypothetical protein